MMIASIFIVCLIKVRFAASTLSLIKTWIHRIEILRIEPILRDAQSITDFTLSNKCDVSLMLKGIYNHYRSIAFGSKRNFSMPKYSTPLSSCQGIMLSLTTTIFLNESGILAYGRTSWSRFSSSPTVSAD